MKRLKKKLPVGFTNQNLTLQIHQRDRSFTDAVRVSGNELVQRLLLVGPSAHSPDTSVPFLPSARFAGAAVACLP